MVLACGGGGAARKSWPAEPEPCRIRCAGMGNVAEVLDDPWKAAMQRGDFAAAWRVSDEVLLRRRASKETCYHWPRHLQYVWTGAPLAGKRVLVRCYHGLGDTIQFIRFTKPLRARARHVA